MGAQLADTWPISCGALPGASVRQAGADSGCGSHWFSFACGLSTVRLMSVVHAKLLIAIEKTACTTHCGRSGACADE
jgi:hypothetical protein